jgi:hypothetical protein
MRVAERPADTAAVIIGRNSRQRLTRPPENPAVEMATFASAVASDPGGEMTTLADRSSAEPGVEMGRFAAAT